MLKICQNKCKYKICDLAGKERGGNLDMRGIDTQVRKTRRAIFREVANMAYHSENIVDDKIGRASCRERV